MASFSDFAREIRTVSVSPGTPGGELVADELATFARAELMRTVERGEGSPVYDLFVNGRPAVSEFEVDMPGAVVYVFSWWGEIISTALSELIKRSPRRKGKYAASFIVLVNGAQVSAAAPVSAGAEVVIVNTQPYTRKIEVGAMQMSVAPGHFNKTRAALRRKFGGPDDGFNFQVKFLDLGAGVHPAVPYVLRGHQRSSSKRALSEWFQVPVQVIEGWRAQGKQLGSVNMLRRQARQNNRSSAFREGRAFLSGRRDSMPGQRLTYPALIMNLAN